ncbi:hypothetical protein EMIT048CA2_170081 [Pseudomonas chlororaphis]
MAHGIKPGFWIHVTVSPNGDWRYKQSIQDPRQVIANVTARFAKLLFLITFPLFGAKEQSCLKRPPYAAF